MEIKVRNLSEIDRAAAELVGIMGENRHFAFHGEMGAGKTTFISAICKALGVEDEVTSPTFSIVNEYRSAKLESPVYHFDFYRIESPEETLDLGLDDYFDSQSVCLMEWPENVEDFLPEDVVDVNIESNPDGSRIIRIAE